MFKRNLVGGVSIVAGFAAIDGANLVLASNEIEEIEITGLKQPARDIQAPVSIDVIAGAELSIGGVSRPQELGHLVSGMYVKPTVGDQNPVFTIRGIGFNDFTSIQNPGTAVYMDQALVPFHTMMGFSLFDIEQVEILKGPQSTLYGRNATAGAINFVARKPGSGNFLRLEYSSWNTLDAEVAYDLLNTDAVKSRISVSAYERFGGFYKNRLNGDNSLGSKDRLAARFLTDFVLDNDSIISVEFRAGRDKSEPVGLEHLASFDATTFTEPCGPVAAGNRSEGVCINALGYADIDNDPFSGDYSFAGRNLDNWLIGGTFTGQFNIGEYELVSISSFNRFEREQHQDIDASPFIILDTSFDDQTWNFSQEIRLSNGETSGTNWLIGMLYTKDSVEASQYNNVFDIAGSAALTTNDQDSESIGFFGHLNFALSDQVTVFSGLRYTHDKKDWSGGTEFIGVTSVSSSGRISDDDVSGVVGIRYQISDKAQVYGSASRGFRSGGFPGAFTLNPSALRPFKRETVYAYEVGYKGLLLNDRVKVTAAAFLYDWQDLQTQLTEARDGLIALFLTNAGDARIYGGEASILWRPVDHFEIGGQLNILDAEIVTSSDPRLQGRELSNAPGVSLSAHARYSIALGGGLLAIDGRVSHQGKRYFTSDNNPAFVGDPYWLANLSLSYTLEDHDLTFRVWSRNVFDRHYRLEGFSQFAYAGSSYHAYGEPRSFGVGVRANF